MGVTVNIDIGEQRDTCELTMQGEGTHVTPSSIPTYSSEPIGTSSLPPRPSTTTTSTCMIIISREFL